MSMLSHGNHSSSDRQEDTHHIVHACKSCAARDGETESKARQLSRGIFRHKTKAIVRDASTKYDKKTLTQS